MAAILGHFPRKLQLRVTLISCHSAQPWCHRNLGDTCDKGKGDTGNNMRGTRGKGNNAHAHEPRVKTKQEFYHVKRYSDPSSSETPQSVWSANSCLCFIWPPCSVVLTEPEDTEHDGLYPFPERCPSPQLPANPSLRQKLFEKLTQDPPPTSLFSSLLNWINLYFSLRYFTAPFSCYLSFLSFFLLLISCSTLYQPVITPSH